MKIIKYYDDLFEANVDCEYLHENGINAMVLNENAANVIPLSFSIPSLRPYLAVADDDYLNALHILGLPDPLTITSDKKCCPECGSEDVKLTFFNSSKNKNNATKLFIFLHIIFCWTGLGKFNRALKCQQCGKEFRP